MVTNSWFTLKTPTVTPDSFTVSKTYGSESKAKIFRY
jgi:hypothetical protein